jgi:16S rRNA (cytosine967-C5)-methyltransferase
MIDRNILDRVWTVALEVLSWIELQRINENSALSKVRAQLNVKNSVVINEARLIVYAVLKRRNCLDYLINKALNPNQLGDYDVGIRSFLRMYTHMIHYTDEPFQKVNDFTKHVRTLLGSKKLRPVEEAIDLIPFEKLSWDNFTPIEVLAYKYYHPVWYIEYLRNYFDELKVVELIKPIDIPKYIRINTLKTDDGLRDYLHGLGLQLAKVPKIKNTYKLLNSSEVLTVTKPYHAGKFLFQDKASALVAKVASPKPTDIVMDICAAPGVKTSHLAQLMGNKGRIISVDYDERRINSWRRLIQKMGVGNAEIVNADASKPNTLPDELADIVVLDPPCTGTGRFNESPSGKWRINKNSIHKMATIQRNLMANAALKVKKGGTLVYSTCSVTFEENEAIITRFLEKYPEFVIREASPRIGQPGLSGLDEAQRLYPYLHECQGFFIAKLVKRNYSNS